MSVVLRAIAVLFTALGAAAVAWLSQVPMPQGADEALIRLSWRTQGVSIEECRTLTPAELERIAPHMRRPQECIGGIADYELVLRVEGREPLVDTIAPAGVRHDRPLYVFQDVTVPPGDYAVSVSFAALVPEDFENGDQPFTFQWSGRMTLEPRDIGLVTLDAAGASLVRR